MTTTAQPTAATPQTPPTTTQGTTTATVQLGTIKITAATAAAPGNPATQGQGRGRQGKPCLTVSSTLLLGALPETAGMTATELCAASKGGEVFIAKAGSCEVGFEVRVEGVAVGMAAGVGVDGEGGVGEVMGLVGGCAVWGDVGLVLKAKYAGDGEGEGGGGRVSFFLHHRDLAMEMVKVVGARVPVVEFRGVEVVLDFRSGRRVKGAGKRKKGKGVGKERKAVVAVEKREPAAQKSHRYGLRRRPTTKVKEIRRDAAAKEDSGKEDEEPPGYAWSIHEMATLLDVGLRKLLGVGRGPQGFRTTKSRPSPSLMEIAPGVWNLRYLQLLETHARAIPAIASGMARLANARSSQLREKVARLGLSGGPASNATDEVDCGEGAEDEIRGRLWSLCQTKIQADPMAKTASQSRTAAVKKETTYESGHLPLERSARMTDDTGASQEYLDVHDGQLVPFEASSSDLRYLPADLQYSTGSEIFFDQHIHPDIFYDIPGHILDGDDTDSSIEYPPWTTFSTSHSDPRALREAHDYLVEGPPGTDVLAYHSGDGGLLGIGDEDFESSQEDHLIVTTHDHHFTMASMGDGFHDEGFQFHHTGLLEDGTEDDDMDEEEDERYLYTDEGDPRLHALGDLEDDITDDDTEEEDEAFIYADGQGNCYTFEPHDVGPHEAGWPEDVHHLVSVQEAPTEEENLRWFHEC